LIGLFSSESVASGHPDKLCDRISDAVLDAYLAADPEARVACEAAAGPGWVLVFGEVRSVAEVDVDGVVRGAISRAGFRSAADGLDPLNCEVRVALVQQSDEIAAGVDRSLEARAGSADPLNLLGAGDQGLMFGYACSETPERMPLALAVAHRVTAGLAGLAWAGPDGKAQVTVRYAGQVPSVESVLVSVQHAAGVSPGRIADDVRRLVVAPALHHYAQDVDVALMVNPSGSFVAGGPAADAGLTGRKIIVDTYGGAARHGGGAFSGKDPSKVDRSAAYALRQVARCVVAAGLADRCEVQAAYAIGVASPVSLMLETFGTATEPVEVIAEAIRRTFDLRPGAIVRDLGLRRPIYEATASGGHFGRGGFPWESEKPVTALKAAVTGLLAG
jgi:S-adenosylmethionine synthetase